jgi:hypothetical protein
MHVVPPGLRQETLTPEQSFIGCRYFWQALPERGAPPRAKFRRADWSILKTAFQKPHQTA